MRTESSFDFERFHTPTNWNISVNYWNSIDHLKALNDIKKNTGPVFPKTLKSNRLGLFMG